LSLIRTIVHHWHIHWWSTIRILTLIWRHHHRIRITTLILILLRHLIITCILVCLLTIEIILWLLLIHALGACLSLHIHCRWSHATLIPSVWVRIIVVHMLASTMHTITTVTTSCVHTSSMITRSLIHIVIILLPPRCGIIESHRSCKQVLSLHLGNRCLSLFLGTKSKESIAF